MASIIAGLGSAVGLGFLYFIAAIPSGVALGLPVVVAGAAAWLGYSLGAVVVLAGGVPLREWLTRKFRIPSQPDPNHVVVKIWNRWGLVGLGILAPVTIGPQAGALAALAFGSRPLPILISLSLGVVPWCVLFGGLSAAGVQWVK